MILQICIEIPKPIGTQSGHKAVVESDFFNSLQFLDGDFIFKYITIRFTDITHYKRSSNAGSCT